MLKLYTFTTENGDILEQVRAHDHDGAVKMATVEGINFSTDFYSESAE